MGSSSRQRSGSRLRTWIFFYLICLVGLLWATFLVATGIWFWVSVWIVLAIVGTNIIVLVLRFR
jgi:Flp pilus assembly protein TadB